MPDPPLVRDRNALHVPQRKPGAAVMGVAVIYPNTKPHSFPRAVRITERF